MDKNGDYCWVKWLKINLGNLPPFIHQLSHNKISGTIHSYSYRK